MPHRREGSPLIVTPKRYTTPPRPPRLKERFYIIEKSLIPKIKKVRNVTDVDGEHVEEIEEEEGQEDVEEEEEEKEEKEDEDEEGEQEVVVLEEEECLV